MKKIIVLGPNPAWQKTLFFPEFSYGRVNRADQVQYFPSGKGINFCRASRCWGKFSALLFQFAGGEIGSRLCSMLDDEKLAHCSIITAHETRTCTTCLCRKTQVMTEIIDPSYPVPPENITEMLDEFSRHVGEACGVVIAGTIPTGTGIELYLRAARIAAENNLPLLVDSWQNIKPVLEVGGKMILKINLDEIAEIAGTRDPRRAIEYCMTRFPLTGVAITDGPDNAYAAIEGHFWEFALPKLEHIVSPLGSGDTAGAIFFTEYLSGTPFEDAFAAGLAAASANCLTPLCGNFSIDDYRRLRTRISIGQLDIDRHS